MKKVIRGVVGLFFLLGIIGCAAEAKRVIAPRQPKTALPLMPDTSVGTKHWEGLMVVQLSSGEIAPRLAIPLVSAEGKIDFQDAIVIRGPQKLTRGAYMFQLPSQLDSFFKQVYVFPDGHVGTVAVKGSCTILSVAIGSDDVPEITAAGGQVIGRPYLANLAQIIKLEGDCSKFQVEAP